MVASDSVTTYGVYANMALGDYYFNNGENIKAKNYYIKAQTIQNKGGIYRQRKKHRSYTGSLGHPIEVADTKLVIKTAFKLLDPEQHYSNTKIKKLITTDAVDLLSHALFEENDINLTETTLSKNSLKSKMSEVALSLIKICCSRPEQ